MSTLSLARGDNRPNLDGPTDLTPQKKTTLVLKLEQKAAASKAAAAKKAAEAKSE